MKGLLRSAVVQDVLAWLVVAYVRLMMRTMRWTIVDRGPMDEALARPPGGMALFWHGRIMLGMICHEVLKAKPLQVMISLSRDGEFIAKASQRLGVATIRGSAGRPGRTMAKGGAAAFIKALAFIKDGGTVAVTPDGPRGPNQVIPSGVVYLARAAGGPVFAGGLAARPAIRFDSWDRAMLPLPFARGCMVVVGPLYAPPDADDETVEALRADWQARFRAAQARAEAILEGAA